MDPLSHLDADRLLSGTFDDPDAELQSALAEYPLDAIGTEYPHYQGSVDGPDAQIEPSERHPVFFGCFDWHSAVHSHWCLLRQLRLSESHPRREEIISEIDERFTPANVRGEVEYFEENPTFECPYGWAWLLRLAAELALWDDEQAEEYRECLRPLESRIAELVESEFLNGDRPFRVGTHDNTAFALAAVWDYATVTGADSLRRSTRDTAIRFFGDDERYPVEYEPLGWDFLSPALTEADLMRRVLDGTEFVEWLDTFLPDLSQSPYDAILDPVDVDSESEDGLELHLVGLNLSKAWCLAGLAETVPEQYDRDRLEASARHHAEAGVSAAFTDAYAGSHWLSSFVLYLLTRSDGGIAPGC
ncbi:DUF2891 family protein [Halovenus sp. WSH3]|uniref:DUF2891 family protein n=1 Tax=Halovenus carboxidivorans TaxID=2692199 RepID=A0A6B0T7V0_9EURY|nr:DUF2891 domain-containing protein [Halovenus carboxidivorans]MXR51271.1 DUF2891 family protein [Halovenus carboxidivorans]